MDNQTNVLGNKTAPVFPNIFNFSWDFRKILMMSVYCVLLVTGLTMNSLVIYAISKKRLLKRSINYFIFNMALADIVLCSLDISVKISMIVTQGRWILEGTLGLISCKIVHFFIQTVPIVSILSLVFMTWDRFAAIVYPTKANLRTHKVRRTCIVMSWVIPVLFTCKNFYSYRISFIFCGQLWGNNHVLILTILKNFYTVAFILIPLGLLTFMYVTIAITLQKRQVFSQNTIPSEQQRIRQKQRKRINILAFTIVVAFAVCHIPMYVVVYFMHAFASKWKANYSTSYQDWVRFSQTLAFANATINPVICIVFNREIRRSIKDLVPHFIRRPFDSGSFTFSANSSSGVRTLEFENRTMVSTNSIKRVTETENI